MTVGESIRFYREKQGLSMEELGRKLQVSQQTVALWETDKTLPTAENLLRLREIFGVPVDAILTASSMPPPAEEPPRETHRFRYSHTELKAVFRALSWKRYWRGMIIYVLLMLCLFALMAAADDSGILACIVLGAFLPGVILRIKGYLKNRKAWESGARRMLGCTYTYELYDWYLKLTVSRDGKIRKTMRIDFFDIERTQEIRGFLVLWAEGQMLLVKTDALCPGSFFYTQCQFSRNRTVKPHGLALPDNGIAAPDLGRAAAVRDSIRETGVFDETDPAVGSRMGWPVHRRRTRSARLTLSLPHLPRPVPAVRRPPSLLPIGFRSSPRRRNRIHRRCSLAGGCSMRRLSGRCGARHTRLGCCCWWQAYCLCTGE